VNGKLVIVGGAPGSGKTTLARKLAKRCAVPLIEKDDVKEAIADALGVGDLTRSRELGRAAFQVMRAVAERSVEGGGTLVLEANFHRERSGPWLRGLVDRADARVVICRADEGVRRDRFISRARAGVRHAVHLDFELLDLRWEPAATFDLELGVPTLAVDTTDGYTPDFNAIVDFIA